MHRSKVNMYIEQGASAIDAFQPGNNMHMSRQLLRTGPFFDQVCYQHDVQVTALCGPNRYSQQTGQWPSSAFLRSIHPDSKIATVTQAGRWDSMQLPTTQVRWNTSLRVLYTILERGRVRKRCVGRVFLYSISLIIVSFAKGFPWGVSIYQRYDLLCQYSTLLRSFMSLCKSRLSSRHGSGLKDGIRCWLS
jgi:hypothetical protein